MPRLTVLPNRDVWTVAGAVLGAAVIAVALAAILPRDERAHALLALTGPGASRELQLTYAEIILAEEFLERPAAELEMDVDELQAHLRTIPSPGALLIRVEARASNEDEAVARAAAVANTFEAYTLETGLGVSASVTVASPARLDDTGRNLPAAGAVGAAAGLLTAVAVLGSSRRDAPSAAASPAQSGVPGRTVDDES